LPRDCELKENSAGAASIAQRHGGKGDEKISVSQVFSLGTRIAELRGTSAHFPKFVLYLSTHLSRTSESYGH
jgi:hypothetical protein